MKRISCLFVSLVLLVNIVACSGYKPIFSSTGSNFKIANFSIDGDKNLSKKIATLSGAMVAVALSDNHGIQIKNIGLRR